MRRQRMRELKVGHVYEVPDVGPCECVVANECRARLRPLRTSVVVVPADPSIGREARTFEARGRAFDVSPTSPLREVTPHSDESPYPAGVSADHMTHGDACACTRAQ